MHTIYATKTISVTELKRNLSTVLSQAGDDPVAVLNHNRPEAYLLSAAHYERLLERLEDLEDAKLAQERAAGPFVEVNIDEL
ncbi:type II toxin-antitoxin system Phd/YefM family antitoxin [Desulfocurvibacter africanus]|uniref:Antitoxin n=1 Tax=Desulfocurvibacter africanus subsp. africanus str. Walvis Bay TaxID=690850 RepID=F3YYA8_DESAF|nr:type II toxin-antitoxin system Phd/YefM family antitoxin [Desulfocurvibacter africanus]EGJ49552.1 prevent-host-death family protein [Desulfocurvibacter africanus subsp. africanus str. Walvis Bay]